MYTAGKVLSATQDNFGYGATPATPGYNFGYGATPKLARVS